MMAPPISANPPIRNAVCMPPTRSESLLLCCSILDSGAVVSRSEGSEYARQKHHKSQLSECAQGPLRTEVSRLRNSYFDAATKRPSRLRRTIINTVSKSTVPTLILPSIIQRRSMEACQDGQKVSAPCMENSSSC